ncbi:Collagen alpha-1(VII) chain [Myotis brandtii]|uniref:Collagen alpha-1(VII) chain n=1 Tax=Myotis brandtii TaxID=109478 RepID=S7MS11_MYOBR|nr:Collagen alpha-1(VII) chain [Myotis brandtii]
MDITGLRPGTSYRVSVSALRGREEGPASVTIARTGGQDQSRVLGPELSGYELDGLEPGTRYHVWLSVLWPSGEGPPTEVTAQTESLRVPGTELRVVDTSVDSVTLAWSPVPGASSYILAWRPLGGREVPGASQTLPSTSSSQRVTGLEPGIAYVFSLTPVQEGVQGPPASVTQSPACPRGLMDVVFLVHTTRDSAHRSAAVKAALERLVSALGPLGPQAVQVGLLSYSHRASPLFPLNGSHDLGVVLQRIRDIPYLDPSGNNLGAAVASAQRYLLAPDAAGRRGQAPGVMVLLVDEPLRGDIFHSIREAQAAGLQVMALGLAGADLEQLRRLAAGTGPVQTFFAVDDGPSLDRANCLALRRPCVRSHSPARCNVRREKWGPEALWEPKGSRALLAWLFRETPAPRATLGAGAPSASLAELDPRVTRGHLERRATLGGPAPQDLSAPEEETDRQACLALSDLKENLDPWGRLDRGSPVLRGFPESRDPSDGSTHVVTPVPLDTLPSQGLCPPKCLIPTVSPVLYPDDSL